MKSLFSLTLLLFILFKFVYQNKILRAFVFRDNEWWSMKFHTPLPDSVIFYNLLVYFVCIAYYLGHSLVVLLIRISSKKSFVFCLPHCMISAYVGLYMRPMIAKIKNKQMNKCTHICNWPYSKFTSEDTFLRIVQKLFGNRTHVAFVIDKNRKMGR